ncbi:hypothetical protein Pth03_18880 [Planotetraspora thailandica]|uniref:Integral membrane bound transporter domain-containing protein n=1 Tax=Planotetraspora thailandica TaxID=487172 RepID=A0A8J3UWT7_9ACTN|nr:FUSC family protein [Planotetraspora thailandica]GII53499.1 hypothetical protein Pth03_18880 [Planotetraspora thailandica]
MRIPRSFIAAVGSAATLAVLAAGEREPLGVIVLGVVLAISLDRMRAGRGSLLVVPVIAVTGLIGALMHWAPIPGEAVFVAAVFVSIHLRRYGARAAAIGRMMLFPLLGLFIVPVPVGHDPWSALLWSVVAGLVALAWTTITSFRAPAREPSREPAAGSVHTRFAAQSAAALALAFCAGHLLFGHWAWVVISAFTVSVGARSRGHVVHRSVQRTGGALLGTATATLLSGLIVPHGWPAAVLIFAYLLAGLALRDRNYVYWSFCVTSILAILYGLSGQAGGGEVLAERLAAVVVGCLCGVLPAWLLLPIKTEAVMRKRLATTLAALGALLEKPDEDRRRDFDTSVAGLRVAAEPGLAWRRLTWGLTRRAGLADCVDLLASCGPMAGDLGGDETARAARGALRRNIGATRTALGLRPVPELLAVPGGGAAAATLDTTLRSVHASVVAAVTPD